MHKCIYVVFQVSWHHGLLPQQLNQLLQTDTCTSAAALHACATLML
jgi:hypothetical protein